MTINRQARISIAATDNTRPAFNSVNANFGKVQRQVAGLGAAFTGLGATVGAVIGGFGIGALVRGVTDGLTALKDLSEATGASIDRLSALQDMAGRTGADFRTVGDALTKFNQALNNADTREIAAVLAAIGVSAAELKALDPAEALLRTAQALGQFADDGNRARAEQVLFGRAVRDIAPLLREYAEAGQQAGSATAEQVAQADAFNKALAATQYNVQLAARSIALDLLPTLNTLGDELRRASEGSGVFAGLATALRIALEALTVSGAYVVDTFRGVVTEVAGIGRQVLALARLDVKGFNAISEAMRADALKARAELDAFVQRVLNAGNTMRAAGGERGAFFGRRFGVPTLETAQGAATGTGARAVREQVSEVDKYIDRLREAILATQDLSAVERARIDINKGVLGSISAGAQAQVLALAKALDTRNEQIRQAKEAQALADEGRRLFEATRTDQERLNQSLERADYLLGQGAIGWSTYGRVVTGSLSDALKKLDETAAAIPQLSGRINEVSEFAQQAGRNIQDALGDSILRVLEGDFKRIDDLWKDLLRRMTAQVIAAELGKKLFGSGVGSGEGWLGSLLRAFGTSSNSPQPRALGGPVRAGSAYLVGERGPELFVPRTGGQIVPNGAGGGGPAFHYAPTINANGDVSPQTLAAIRAEIDRDRTRWMRQLQVRGMA